MTNINHTKFVSVPTEARHSFRLTKGNLTIVTDLTKKEISNFDLEFELSCSSGRVPNKSTNHRDLEFDSGCVLVTFADLCMESNYTLKARTSNGEEIVVFEDVPYKELKGLSDQIDEVSIKPY